MVVRILHLGTAEHSVAIPITEEQETALLRAMGLGVDLPLFVSVERDGAMTTYYDKWEHA